MNGGLFTEHDMFSVFLIGLAVGLLAGGFAVAALLAHAVGRDIDRAVTLPDPDAQGVDDSTERISAAPVIDLPRRPRGTFEELA